MEGISVRPAQIPEPPRDAAGLLALAAGDGDMLAQLQAMADEGSLTQFLAQVDDAVTLAGRSPIFAQELDPLLGDVRDALGQLPADGLSRTERDAVESARERLDAYLGEVDSSDAPDGTDTVPGGGLDAHEDAGGHLIERHVGKSEADLLDRLQRENISASSSFRDLPEAELFVARTLLQNQDRIDAWLDGQGGNRLVVDARFDASTGISIERGETRAEDVFSVRLVLERSNALDIGYRIVTGYPTAP